MESEWPDILFDAVDPVWVEVFVGDITNFVEDCENCREAIDDGYSCCTEHEGPLHYESDPESWGVCLRCGRISDCFCDIYSCGRSVDSKD